MAEGEEEMSLMKKLLILMVISFLSLGVMGCMSESEKEELLGYLEEKYGGKYEVVKYWTENDGTSKLYHQMLVHPEGEPEHLFKAGKFWDPTEKKDVLWDNFIEVKWSLDYTRKHKNEVTSLTSEEMDVQFIMNFPGEPHQKYKNMSFEDYLRENRIEASELSGVIGIAIKCEQEQNKQQKSELIYEIYKKIGEFNYKSFTIGVVFVKSTKFEEAKKLLKMKQADSLVSLEALGGESYQDIVYLYDIDTINSPKDILDKFLTRE